MLTRKTSALPDCPDWTEDYGLTIEEFFALPKAQAKALEDQFWRDHERAVAKLDASYQLLTPLQKYRYDRRLTLQVLLRTRARRDKYIGTMMADFMVPREQALLKKMQHALIDLRRRLRTGIEGGSA
jgi:hypothetical protein